MGTEQTMDDTIDGLAMSDTKGLVTIDEMVAALRDYPDADFSKHVVAAEETLLLHERSNRLARSRREWIDAVTIVLGAEWNGGSDDLRRDLAAAIREARATALEEAADEWASGRDEYVDRLGWLRTRAARERKETR